MSKVNIRTAVIGIGNMGSAHAKCIGSGAIRGMDLIAVCDLRPERLSWAEKELPEARRFTDYRQLISSGDVDAVIIAVGAEPLILPLPGMDNGVVATSVYGKEDTLGKNVVIIGGGQVGCETALHLIEHGIHVSIVEMQSKLAPDASPTCRTEMMVLLQDEAEKGMFTELTSARCQSVEPGKVNYLDGDGNLQSVTGDTIILASGMRSKSALADSFMTIDVPECVEIGDCVRARTAEQATREGWYAAVNL